ncbi:hypothetical protein CKA32_005313 [Geitlerinema sp. FC II]|nr:hypothetical protein CKA32_005313 [Geitlerinema sp. FC II]
MQRFLSWRSIDSTKRFCILPSMGKELTVSGLKFRRCGTIRETHCCFLQGGSRPSAWKCGGKQAIETRPHVVEARRSRVRVLVPSLYIDFC